MTDLDKVIERLRERLEDRLRRTDLEISGAQYFLRTASAEKIRTARKERADRMEAITQAYLRGEATSDQLRRETLAASAKTTMPTEWLDPEPAPLTKLQEAEQGLGFELPESLKAIYMQVGDGGFGPGYGLLPIHLIVDEYVRARDHSALWPEMMLPITDTEAEQYCIRSPRGEVWRFDFEKLDEDDGNLPDCFLPVADSIAEWLEGWLNHDPEAERAEVDRLVAAHGTPRWFEAWVVRVRALTPEQREKLSLPGDDWEENARAGLIGR